MAKRNKQIENFLLNVGIVIIILIVLGIIVYGIYLEEKAHRYCNQICTEVGAITYDVHHSGNYSKFDDICICYKTDSIFTIRIDEWNALTYLAEICEHKNIQGYCSGVNKWESEHQ